MTSRRQFMLAATLGAVLDAVARNTSAQAKAPVGVGMLSPRPLKESSYAPGIAQRLGTSGYRDGSTMAFHFRSADGVKERYPALARDLFKQNCRLIFAIGTEPALALRDARSPVPVVFIAVDQDPVKAGLVSSLRRPDGNLTGVYLPVEGMVTKRIEILRETLGPSARRFLVLADRISRNHVPLAQNAAAALGIEVSAVDFPAQPYDFAAAFETGRQARVNGVVLLNSPVFSANRATVAALLLKYRLPGIGFAIQHAEAGFLLSFNADAAKATRRVAEIGVQILKGAKPEDIPVEQADEFELAVNAKTARALGLKIPESVLARATRIIQ